MARLAQLMKRDVLALDVGKAIGRPADFLVHPKNHTVVLIVLSYGKIPETSIVCPASAVQSFDTDTLAISGLKALRLAVHDQEFIDQLHRGIRLRGRTVFSHEGKALGRVVNIHVDNEGHVTEYRLRRARLGLLRRTILMLPADVERIGPEVIVAKTDLPSTPPSED